MAGGDGCKVQAWIGVGSNLDGPRAHVLRAFVELAQIPDTRLLRRSSLYRSRPMGPQDQPHYVNAVALVETTLPALELLHAMQGIEAAHRRVRSGQRWGPRTLDLDLLLYGQERIAGDELTVPHPGIGEREFVLYPLIELDPELRIPDLGPVKSLVEQVGAKGLERLREDD